MDSRNTPYSEKATRPKNTHSHRLKQSHAHILYLQLRLCLGLTGLRQSLALKRLLSLLLPFGGLRAQQVALLCGRWQSDDEARKKGVK